MGGEAWYLLHSKPRKEGQLNAYLRAQGLETFYPTLRVKPVNPRAATIRPYFPRYLFAHVDLDVVGLSTLRWTPGLARLVEFGGLPATVQEHVIEQLRQRIEQIKQAGGLDLDDLQPGDPVRIVSGPLAGYEAIFDVRLSGSERVRILLDMVGRHVQVKINTNAIEKKH